MTRSEKRDLRIFFAGAGVGVAWHLIGQGNWTGAVAAAITHAVLVGMVLLSERRTP